MVYRRPKTTPVHHQSRLETVESMGALEHNKKPAGVGQMLDGWRVANGGWRESDGG